jgi:hypothetical protein
VVNLDLKEHITQLLNQLAHLNEILYYGNVIKDDLDHSKMAACQSVCVSPAHKFWTRWYIFMKFGTDVVPFKGTWMK